MNEADIIPPEKDHTLETAIMIQTELISRAFTTDGEDTVTKEDFDRAKTVATFAGELVSAASFYKGSMASRIGRMELPAIPAEEKAGDIVTEVLLKPDGRQVDVPQENIVRADIVSISYKETKLNGVFIMETTQKGGGVKRELVGEKYFSD